MPKIHRGGWVSDAGQMFDRAPTGPEPGDLPDVGDPDTEGGDGSSPGISSSGSPRKRRTKTTTNATGSLPPAPTTDNP